MTADEGPPGPAAPPWAGGGERLRTLTVRGRVLRVAVRDGDPDWPPLLLCNGIGVSLELLQPFVDALDPRRGVIRFDMPGVGGSPAPVVPYHLITTGPLLAGLLDQLGHERADVLGISWGGGLAQQFALSRPDRVRRLVLVATAPGALMVPGHPRVLRHLLTPRRHRDPRYSARIAAELYGGSARKDPAMARELLHATTRLGPARGYYYQLMAGLGWTSLPLLPRLRPPTLILAGDDDPIIPLVNARIMHRLIPGSQLHIYHGGHLELAADAERLAPAVEAFLDAGPLRALEGDRIVTNLASNLDGYHPCPRRRMAVRVDDAAMTYRELDEASARVAGLLHERGLKPGDRVGLMMPNVAEVPVVYYGVLRAGGVVVPMNPLLKAREVAYYLGDSGAGLIFAWHAFADQARGGAGAGRARNPSSWTGSASPICWPPPRRMTRSRTADDEDTAVILYTSGTTGHPKGAELTHGNLLSNTEVARADIVRAGPDDVIFGGLPLFHVFGQTVALNVAVASGACLTLLPRFDPEHALRIIAGHRVTVFEGVPTMYVALLHQPDRADYDTSALRMCISGGAALPVEVLRGFEEAFGVPVLEGYGLSETSPVASFNHPGRERKPGSIGTPIRDVQMRVVDGEDHEVPQGEVGEIVIRGPNVMKGYWQRPEATAEAIRDGWFHSGDLARVDEDGYFYIVDRKKDLIIRGGYNVYPREIEEVLYEHPAVAEAAVIGLPHPALGEEVGAAVALKPGAVISAEELRDYVKGQVAAYKYPRHVWIVDALPKGPTGKIQKRDIVIPADLAVP